MLTYYWLSSSPPPPPPISPSPCITLCIHVQSLYQDFQPWISWSFLLDNKLIVRTRRLWNVRKWLIFRLSNHPDFVRIISILLENPESWPICDQDRKDPNFDSCCDIFVKFSDKRTQNAEYLTLMSRKTEETARNIK